MTNIMEQTLANLVVNNQHAVSVLEKYNLDYCCKGKRTFADACAEKGLSSVEIARELEEVNGSLNLRHMPFSEMTAEQLISHIVVHHHFYVKQIMPQIHRHLEKVALKHGDRFPWMIQAFQLFAGMMEEMTLHMQKEEMILFPMIKKIEKSFVSNEPDGLTMRSINGPMSAMEREHDHAGEIMFQIRSLTNNYAAPEGACTTFKISLAELKEFEEDLHQHVHLENNILFPMAQRFGDDKR